MHISPSIRQPGKHTKQRFDFINFVTSLGLFQFNHIQAEGAQVLLGCTKTACNRLMKLSDF